ncbi:hypothetical protein [Butyrivibrio sp. MC2013]|uniref:hypothetical protein n=1 Tax=Butyrivibrio sp. MC2013 TaxID=1280686 RepID=UPI0004155379|nr:hypothetical protein [Butyrivibrio sp. MC2013]
MEHINYFKDTRWKTSFYRLSVAFFFALFVMPAYFGIDIKVFDLSVQRIFMLALLVFIFEKRIRSREFLDIIKNNYFTPAIAIYSFITLYTGGLRGDVNAFLRPFIDLVCFYLLVYIIKNSLGVEKTLDLIYLYGYLLCFQGIIEFLMKRSLFSYLETLKGMYSGAFIRNGSYRVMGPCNHSLSYGLLLLVIVPLACYKYKEKEINLFARPFLIIMLFINVILNGSRSSLGLVLIELFLLMIFSEKKYQKRNGLLIMCVVFVILVMVIFFTKSGPAQYILRSFATLVDTVLGTEYAVRYGAESERLAQSAEYRKQLLNIFHVSFLNPFIGRGVKRGFAAEINGAFIHSVDNFYICLFIKYAYPGMIAYILFMIQTLQKQVVAIKKGYKISVVIIIALSAFYINLWYMDHLMTIKYTYVLLAIFCVECEELVNDKKKSIYLK